MPFDKFRKYHKRILIILTVIIILPFGIGSFFYSMFEAKPPSMGRIDGEKISPNTFYEMPNLWNRVLGWFPSTSRELNDEDIWFVQCALAAARDSGLSVAKTEIEEFIRYRLQSMRLSQDSDGLNRMLKSMNLTRDQLMETIRQAIVYTKFVGMQQYGVFTGGYLGQTVYASTEQARETFLTMQRKADVEYVLLSARQMESQVTATPDEKEIQAYYEKHSNDDWLRVPEAIVLEYSGAPYAEYEKVIQPPSEKDVLGYYERHKEEFAAASATQSASQPATKAATRPASAPASASATRPWAEVRQEIFNRLAIMRAIDELGKLISLAYREIAQADPEKADLKAAAERFGLHYDKTRTALRREQVASLPGIGAEIPPRRNPYENPKQQERPKTFEELAFSTPVNQFLRVQNREGIYLMRVLQNNPAHSPKLDEGDTRQNIVARIKAEKMEQLAQKEADELLTLWKGDAAKFKAAVAKYKDVKLESKSVTQEELPIGEEIFKASSGSVHSTPSEGSVYVWRLEGFKEPDWNEFEKSKMFYKQFALYKDMSRMSEPWRKEILKHRTQDNSAAYHKWNQKTQKGGRPGRMPDMPMDWD